MNWKKIEILNGNLVLKFVANLKTTAVCREEEETGMGEKGFSGS